MFSLTCYRQFFLSRYCIASFHCESLKYWLIMRLDSNIVVSIELIFCLTSSKYSNKVFLLITVTQICVSSNDIFIFYFIFLIWWLQMAFIAICYMNIDLFALQHIADRPGKYRTYDAHQSLCFDLSMFLHGDVSVGHL